MLRPKKEHSPLLVFEGAPFTDFWNVDVVQLKIFVQTKGNFSRVF
jgi:hypothetical protein